MRYAILVVLVLSVFFSCKKKDESSITNQEKTLFSLLKSETSGVDFKNTVKENLYFNFLNYPYIYNGGGVAVGDINNDGLDDIYFTANQGSNKLYLNQGNLKFKDITSTAKVADSIGWSTGVTMVDVNNDGWLDIYVSKSGSLDNHDKRKNKLYINQKDNTFKEQAKKFGLDFYGFSIQSHFFDMDKDGDLDMYLVNHRVDFRNNIIVDVERDKKIEDYGSDQLFKNENGRFVNVTDLSGVANKAWGLSAVIGDFNNDNWPDIFVANDFFHPDYLYVNNQDGTFTDKSLTVFNHLSNSSMGSDFEDINNDLLPDLVVLDMLAEDHIRAKKNMASMNTNSFKIMVDNGYHHQYMSNVLQLNNGNSSFSEIAHLSGIAKTDWSWASLIADFDNDGYKDIFITNGIENDLSNQDFRDQMRKNIMSRKKVTLDEAINMMPSQKLQNYIFKNNGDLTFSKTSDEWGIKELINSNGAAYSDLDNDGDLDLIINNQSEKASIYQNNSTKNHITFSVEGPESNPKGIGVEMYIYSDDSHQFKQLYVERGYQSSVTQKLHFGLGNRTTIDSAIVVWPDGSKQLLNNIKSNQIVAVSYENATQKTESVLRAKSLFEVIDAQKIGLNYKQEENSFNDFDLQLLLPQKQSEFSTPIATADFNNDGLEDLFIGNAKDAKATLYVQTLAGKFRASNEALFETDKKYEDTDAVFFDADNDGDLDLYVSSGGYEIQTNSELLQDRLYINIGNGKFEKSNALPKMLSNTSSIAFSDYDNDGDLDIFTAARATHGKYPLHDKSFLLENNNGKFVDVTSKRIDKINEFTIINDAIFSDFDGDGDKDLIAVGEWMPVTVFENNQGHFSKKELLNNQKSNGWFQTIKEVDIDNDGNKDYLVGNWGNNNKFHPTKDKPLHIYADYFDDNTSFDMALSKVSKSGELLPVRGKECSSEQTPFLKQKIGTYEEFAKATMPQIYGDDRLENATHYEVHDFNTSMLKNMGDGSFKIVSLPNEAQFSPTLSFETFDFNGDGLQDIFGVGNVYDSEVETIRYDASKGYILLNNKDSNFRFLNDNSYFNNKEAKAVKHIKIKGISHFIVLNKRGYLKILRLNNSSVES